MTPWTERPPEIANLFNPAFCGILVARAVGSFVSEAGDGMPFPLTFLILPIVLHEQTREALPRSKATWMIQWLQRNPEVRMGFASRTRSLSPCTRESLMFMFAHGYLLIGAGGKVSPGAPSPRVSELEGRSQEYKKCIGKADLLGKMLARAGTTATIFALWGVRP
jgi:hypothetical protein